MYGNTILLTLVRKITLNALNPNLSWQYPVEDVYARRICLFSRHKSSDAALHWAVASVAGQRDASFKLQLPPPRSNCVSPILRELWRQQWRVRSQCWSERLVRDEACLARCWFKVDLRLFAVFASFVSCCHSSANGKQYSAWFLSSKTLSSQFNASELFLGKSRPLEMSWCIPSVRQAPALLLSKSQNIYLPDTNKSSVVFFCGNIDAFYPYLDSPLQECAGGFFPSKCLLPIDDAWSRRLFI